MRHSTYIKNATSFQELIDIEGERANSVSPNSTMRAMLHIRTRDSTRRIRDVRQTEQLKAESGR